MKYCRLLVLTLFVYATPCFAVQMIESNPPPPGYGGGGGGPSGFNVRDIPDSPEPPASSPRRDVPQRPSTNPNGDIPPPGTPMIEVAPPNNSIHMQNDGTVMPETGGGSSSIEPSTTLLAHFNGGTATNFNPADAAGAINSSYVISALNNRYNFYNRSGSLIKTTDGNGFLCNGPQVINGCPGTGLNPSSNKFLSIDPQILWDSGNSRWLTSANGQVDTLFVTLNVTYVAVSQTSNPTGQWDLYYFFSCGNNSVADQPKLGIDNSLQWFFVELSACGTTSGIPKDNLHVFYQPSLYNGTPPNSTNHFMLSDLDDLDRPAVTYSASPPFGWEFLISSGVTNGTPFENYSYISADASGLPVLASNYLALSVNVAPLTATYNIPAGSTPACSSCIGTIDDARIKTATVQNLSNGHPAVIAPLNFGLTNGSTQIYDVVMDISNPFSPVGAGGSHLYTNPGGTAFYASAALTGDGNSVMLQYDFTAGPGGNGLYPSVYVFTPGAIGSFKQGVAATLVSNRWGDYTTMVPDPANAKATWSIGSFLNSSGIQNQWWAQVSE